MLDIGVGNNGGPHGHAKVLEQQFLEQIAITKLVRRAEPLVQRRTLAKLERRRTLAQLRWRIALAQLQQPIAQLERGIALAQLLQPKPRRIALAKLVIAGPLLEEQLQPQQRLARSPIRHRREPDRRERDAPSEERHAAQRPWRPRRPRDQPQAGDRDRSVGSTKEGSQGSRPPRRSCLTGSSPSSGPGRPRGSSTRGPWVPPPR
ncbi:MAG TPA: hypothetical protein VJ826_10115 [Candidatus Polarisedimenticolaceae bacterium]|nr:hypothetical protein [Candidatus Polarisedimenticolaceae bacterium]